MGISIGLQTTESTRRSVAEAFIPNINEDTPYNKTTNALFEKNLARNLLASTIERPIADP